MSRRKYIVEMEWLAGNEPYSPDELLELLCATSGREYDIKWYSCEAVPDSERLGHEQA